VSVLSLKPGEKKAACSVGGSFLKGVEVVQKKRRIVSEEE